MSKRVLMMFSAFAMAISALPVDLLAQTDLAAQTLGRGFWHVFAAYAIVWALVFGWVVRIGRQLARVERKLDTGQS
jgi:CcmD family protein